METSQIHQDNHSPPQQQTPLPSPNSHSSSSSNSSSSTTTNSNTGLHQQQQQQQQPQLLPSPKPITRSESANPYPTTFVQADTSSFKQVVQMLTGSPKPVNPPTSQPDPSPKTHHHNIPPIKSIPKKTQSSAGFKLYERRNSLKNLKINPLNPIFAQPGSGFSPRKPEILSPSILDFPALVLSPVTPLIPDPFDRSGSGNYNSGYSPMGCNNGGNGMGCNLVDVEAEEKAIKEKGFYLHPSPREAEPPRLLPLFPVTSPRVASSGSACANP